MTTMPTILRCEIFPDDLDATADFYTSVLGFEVVADRRAADDPYLTLHRDSVRIGAARRGDDAHPEHRRPPTGVELVFEVDDLEGSWSAHAGPDGQWPRNSRHDRGDSKTSGSSIPAATT